jgi:hypothetical protein
MSRIPDNEDLASGATRGGPYRRMAEVLENAGDAR